MNIQSPRRRAEEEGQASLFLLLGLAFSLLAIMVLFIRLGNANDLRSQAQTAADSAALAAVGEMQDRMAESLANGGLSHSPHWNEGTGKSAAEEYARENKGVVTDVRASDNAFGFTGNHVRVTVRGAQCQRELEEDRSRDWKDTPCQGNEEEEEIDTFSGEADAIARVEGPTNCSIAPGWDNIDKVQCDGKVIHNERDARSVISVQLVDQEGEYLYDDSPANIGGAPSGPMGDCDAPGPGIGKVTPKMCEAHKAVLKKFPEYMDIGLGCYRDNGGVPGGGEHPKGRACDYMTNMNGSKSTGEKKALGDATAEWIKKNADELNVKYVIWEQHIWNPDRASEGWRKQEDRGGNTNNHYDHVHLSIKK